METKNQSETLSTLRLDMSFSGMQIEIDWFRKLKQSAIANESWHSHRSNEIHFMMDGENDIYYNDGHITLSKGDAVIIPGGVMHKLANSSGCDYERYVLSYSITETYREDAANLKKAMLVNRISQFELTDEIKDILQNCSLEMEMRKLAYVSVIKCNVMELLILTARELSGHPKEIFMPDEDIFKVTYNTKSAHDIEAYIKANAERNTSISDIAEYMHLSCRHVQRLVNAEYGCSTKQMIDNARMMCAEKYLKESQFSIKQIALLMGFNSTQSFCRFFRKNNGQSPNEYRKGSMGKG